MSHSKVGQQLLGLTLRVNPWLWNWVQVAYELCFCSPALFIVYMELYQHIVNVYFVTCVHMSSDLYNPILFAYQWRAWTKIWTQIAYGHQIKLLRNKSSKIQRNVLKAPHILHKSYGYSGSLWYITVYLTNLDLQHLCKNIYLLTKLRLWSILTTYINPTEPFFIYFELTLFDIVFYIFDMIS